MCQLLRQGYIAALAPVGVPNCDIVVTDDIGDRLCAVQVKTRRDIGSDGGWHMGKKHEGLISPTLFYCFVDFGKTPTDAPSTYVVPADVVANALAVSHAAWLAQPGAKGQQRKQTEFRRFLPSYDHLDLQGFSLGWLHPYREAWYLLNQSAEIPEM
jgi:hypothetical protein